MNDIYRLSDFNNCYFCNETETTSHLFIVAILNSLASFKQLNKNKMHTYKHSEVMQTPGIVTPSPFIEYTLNIK